MSFPLETDSAISVYCSKTLNRNPTFLKPLPLPLSILEFKTVVLDLQILLKQFWVWYVVGLMNKPRNHPYTARCPSWYDIYAYRPARTLLAQILWKTVLVFQAQVPVPPHRYWYAIEWTTTCHEIAQDLACLKTLFYWRPQYHLRSKSPYLLYTPAIRALLLYAAPERAFHLQHLYIHPGVRGWIIFLHGLTNTGGGIWSCLFIHLMPDILWDRNLMKRVLGYLSVSEDLENLSDPLF